MKLSRWNFPARDTQKAQKNLDELPVTRTIANEGVTFHPLEGSGQEWLRQPAEASSPQSLVALLAQLEEEGYAQARGADLFCPGMPSTS